MKINDSAGRSIIRRTGDPTCKVRGSRVESKGSDSSLCFDKWILIFLPPPGTLFCWFIHEKQRRKVVYWLTKVVERENQATGSYEHKLFLCSRSLKWKNLYGFRKGFHRTTLLHERVNRLMRPRRPFGRIELRELSVCRFYRLPVVAWAMKYVLISQTKYQTINTVYDRIDTLHWLRWFDQIEIGWKIDRLADF